MHSNASQQRKDLLFLSARNVRGAALLDELPGLLLLVTEKDMSSLHRRAATSRSDRKLAKPTIMPYFLEQGKELLQSIFRATRFA